MNYSWLEVIKKSLDSLDRLASRLKVVSAGEPINDHELRTVVSEIEENTSRVSRLLTLEKNVGILSKYNITARDLYLLTPSIDDDTRKSLLQGNRKVFFLIANRLSEAIKLWRERIIYPAEVETPVLENVAEKRVQINELPSDSRVCLFLGAGASRMLNIPVMSDFWRIIHVSLKSNEEKLAMKMLLEAAKDETTSLPPDLEKLLDMLDRYETYFRILWKDPHFGLPSFSLKYSLPFQPLFPWNREKPLKQSLRRLGHTSIGIYRIIDRVNSVMHAYYTKSLNKSELFSLYDPIFSLITSYFRDNSITIFTTNYDTAIEQYCRYGGIKLIDGFQKNGSSLLWNPEEYYQKPDQSQKVITLFKLHGSFTWRKIGNEIIEFGMSTQNILGDRVLIYPTETKEYPDEEPFKTAYKSLDHYLKKAEVAIVIGYSFRDRGVMYIIDEAQYTNPDLRFIIVCGEKPEEDTRKRYPYGSHVIECDFKPGNNPDYLIRLEEIINEILKAN